MSFPMKQAFGRPQAVKTCHFSLGKAMLHDPVISGLTHILSLKSPILLVRVRDTFVFQVELLPCLWPCLKGRRRHLLLCFRDIEFGRSDHGPDKTLIILSMRPSKPFGDDSNKVGDSQINRRLPID